MQRPPALKPIAQQETAGLSDGEVSAILPDPVIILSAPRAGSTLMFEQVSRLAPFWSIGGESHGIYREFPHLRMSDAGYTSMALGAKHADPATVDMFRRLFVLLMRDHRGERWLDMAPEARPQQVCLVEKTPRNALNIPFLLKVFPGARFVFLHREPRQNVASLIEAWSVGMQKGNFVTFRDLPGWPLPGWCFLLPPGWQALKGKSLAEIAAFQWLACNEAIMGGLAGLPRKRWTSLSYKQFTADPGAAISRMSTELGVGAAPPAFRIGQMALSRSTVSRPDPEKWRRFEGEMSAVFPELSAMQDRIDRFCS